jgi:SAM-dependent methyltransferase
MARNISKEKWIENMSGSFPDKPEWYEPLIKETVVGDRCLELGCGTGMASDYLNRRGRDSYKSDYAECFATDIVLDVTKEWKIGRYNLIFSVGLLEHFDDNEVIGILKKSIEHSDKVIALVPNGKCSGYKKWRKELENNGRWNYGNELARTTMVPLFNKAGMDCKEYSVGNDFGEEENKYLLVTIGTKWKKKK